ncbi:uncharacterized protein LOC111695435 isoform X2 [Eurytemora carolleeae]|uniref:uncharacterized protein LOC111695435 isoform X2 n=1 Tax=Eurytemora carolleeae TaxID=1294199 RepID=UPI000C791F12|nr:uncharacterized protein LOC111695435 isoform X2 [Eurytemora carolleeae]|eukprot:XP_023320544.1 uncharacterized protein LOC111695435 isoform X2 [Eurytemora affinis]
MKLLVFISTFSLWNSVSSAECELGRSCVTLRECPLIMQQLRLAQSARSDRSFGVMNNILSAIKSSMCENSSNTVCCPLYLGALNIEVANDASPVYALNSTTVRILEFPVQGEQDVLEPYFWRDTECLPVIEYHIAEETFNFNYSPEKTYLDLNLPPTLSMASVRCMGLWKEDTLLGFAHLKLPWEEVEQNNIEDNSPKLAPRKIFSNLDY